MYKLYLPFLDGVCKVIFEQVEKHKDLFENLKINPDNKPELLTIKLSINKNTEKFKAGNFYKNKTITVATEKAQASLPVKNVTSGESYIEALSVDKENLKVALKAALRIGAVEQIINRGGVALHASSALAKDNTVFIFAGKSGCGKTTSAMEFGQENLLDEDMVMLIPGEEKISRMPALDLQAREKPSNKARQIYPVKAIFLPEKSENFDLQKLDSFSSIKGCLHIPSWLKDTGNIERIFDNTIVISKKIPVIQLKWLKGQPLEENIYKTIF
jgi:hypothetical protein